MKYDESLHPPLLTMFVHGAPHRRIDNAVINQYRVALIAAARQAKIEIPIDMAIDLDVYFIDPTSPDLDNLITALYRALDGRVTSRPGVIADDSLIQRVRMSKLYPSRRIVPVVDNVP
jgi:Holliday junction resolvase RusA-like endonuclease